MEDIHLISDHQLLAHFIQGDDAAYVEIYERYKGILHLHAYKKLGDFEEAKDVVQELFLNVWNKREELPLAGNLSGYLYNALRNRILNRMAHQKVASTYFSSLANFASASQTLADHKVRESQLAALIEKEINNLPEKMREVFILSRKEGLSHNEIAKRLSISEETVKRQIKNALKILRGRLGLMLYVVILSKIR